MSGTTSTKNKNAGPIPGQLSRVDIGALAKTQPRPLC